MQYLGRTPITIWCVAHRSDLAFESIEFHIPEWCHLLANLQSLAAYFRSSNIREEDIRLNAQNLGCEQEVKQFRMHHDVRFPEHLFNWLMLPLQIRTSSWCTGVRGRETGTKAQKTQCNGILKMKQSDSLNWRLTYVVGDLLNQFWLLQKEAQRTFITMANLLKQRETNLSSLIVPIQEVEKKSTSPAFPTSLQWRWPPSFQAGRIQFIGYNFHILWKSPGVKQ